MALKEFKRYMSTGTMLLILISVIGFLAYLIATFLPTIFTILCIIFVLGVAAFVLGLFYEIFTEEP